MKKYSVLLLVLVFIVTLAGCNIPGFDEVDSNSSDKNIIEEKSLSSSYLTQNIEEFMNIANDVLNISDYSEEADTDGTRVRLTNNNEIAAPDMCVEIDGFKFSLPVKYSELIDAGWTEENNIAEEKLESDCITSPTFKTTSGKYVTLSFVNFGEKAIKVKDAEAVKLEIVNVDNDSASIDDPPSFEVLGGINNNTDLKGILEVAGAPSFMDITDYNDSEYLVYSTIQYKCGDDCVEIEYNFEDDIISSVTMEYGIANSVVTY